MPKYKIPPPVYWSTLPIEQFAGINQSVTETQIDLNESPDMMNMVLDERGALDKRFGYKQVSVNSLGTPILELFAYDSGTSEILLAITSTKLYKLDANSNLTEIGTISGSPNIVPFFFVMNSLCYFFTGLNYYKFDGATLSTVATSPYIPTLFITMPPAGGGSLKEAWNLLGAGFKNSFSADGTATTYQLSLKGLDATTVTAIVNGTSISEGSGLTVNRTTGIVTFTTAPAKGNDNVIITAYKTIAGNKEKILNCQFSAMYGGNNDTRVFASGNPNYRHMIFQSALYDPTYFPDTTYLGIGSNNEAITGLAHHYDTLVVYKEDSIWDISYEIRTDGTPAFPLKPVNDFVGCKNGRSIQLLENAPVSITSKGLYMLQGGTVRDERNVTLISEKINKSLLGESLAQVASSDFEGKYILTINHNTTYVYDYRASAWFLWDNIPAICYLEKDGYLYFGTNTGILCRMAKVTDVNPFTDNEQPISAYWESKLINFGKPWLKKHIEKIFCSLKPNVRSSITIYYYTDSQRKTLLVSKQLDLFSFSYMDFTRFSFMTSFFPKEIPGPIKARKALYVKLRIESGANNDFMGITGINIKFRYLRNEVK